MQDPLHAVEYNLSVPSWSMSSVRLRDVIIHLNKLLSMFEASAVGAGNIHSWKGSRSVTF